MMNLQGKKVVVIGFARSGMASAQLLLHDRAIVTLNDCRDEQSLTEDERDYLQAHPSILFVGGGHPVELVDADTAMVIKNPGVPMHLPPLQRAKALGIPVITEIEHASWKIEAQLVAITGTNGKTTTTSLTGEIYKASGVKTFVVGNIGLPLSSVALEIKPDDVVVAELSSFQLEGTLQLRPRIAAILNITPDHLDHHGTMEAYRKAKAMIFANQRENDAIVLNADDPEAYALRKDPMCRVYLFSRKRVVERGAFVQDGMIILRDGKQEITVCRTDEVAIPGTHNLENALAASVLAWLGGVDPVVIAKVLTAFPGVPHRLEFVRTLKGVDYINDSKGTNTDASIKALEAISKRIILIAGGYEKGADFAPFVEAMHNRVAEVILIGSVAKRLAAVLDTAGFSSYKFADSLEEAVSIAAGKAQTGDVVLLSPACASWDMFRDFEERGDLFKKAVWALGGYNDGQ